MKKAFVLLLILICAPAWSQNYRSSCWLLSDLRGMAYYQSENYAPRVDGFSKPIKITFDGKNTSAAGSSLSMFQIDEFMAVGMGKDDTFAVIETYQIDPSLGVALYTKAINGKSIFSDLSGSKTFIGRAERCK